MANPMDGVSRFDRFTLDHRQRILMRDGEIVRLTPKAFDLLELLVSRPDEVVPKAELVERVWPDTFVSDANLSKLVFTIRKELGGDYIETIPKRGYRFAAPAKESRRNIRSPLIIAIAIVIVLAGVSVMWWRAHTRPSVRERVYLIVMPFTPLMGGDESLAAGISEFVTARLSTIQGIAVMPAMMAGASPNSDPRAI